MTGSDHSFAHGATDWLARRILEARTLSLDGPLGQRAVDRIIDAVAAGVSGSLLPPGQAARAWVRQMGGTAEASLIGEDLRVPAVNAALANAMMAHADETDDVDLKTKAHPGSSVVPAAIATAQRCGADGAALVRAVIAGYDIACRILRGLDSDAIARDGRSLQGISSTFGAAAAAACLEPLSDEVRLRHVVSYAAQQASGIGTWPRDPDHVEKAFDLAGMGARNGVTAATMVSFGMTAVDDVLGGDPPGLRFLSPHADAARMMDDPTTWMIDTAIKPYPVGYPITAVAEALLDLLSEEPIDPAAIDRIVVRLPPDGARIVDGREIPSINVQHVTAVVLVDGQITFASVHDVARVFDPEVRAITRRVELIPDPEMWDPVATRQASVEVDVAGRKRYRHVRFARGTPQRPLTSAEVCDKALELIADVIGEPRAHALVEALTAITTTPDLEAVGRLLEGPFQSTPEEAQRE